MKRLIFSIFSILQFVGMASSCKKCVTCTLWYYGSVYVQSPRYCGDEQQIIAFEKGYNDLDSAFVYSETNIVCDESH